jgi:alkanesulfonate monooxygenase SsuD/methylene tetrahydromethanopterin reductase-like flavin-dependent oxidoreductase (luciferase family)
LKLAWGDEPFRFKGRYYEYPHPQEGTPWPAHEWTRQYGFPGEVDEQGRIQMINVIPKPYQRPHPPLFQAFSLSEETVRWCAREGIRPTIILPQPEVVRKLGEAYVEESRKAGRTMKLGQNIGVLRGIYLADSVEQARRLAERGMCVLGFREVFHHFGFTEAWREPADEEKYPAGKIPLPASEVTAERIQRVKFASLGTVDDVRRGLDELVEKANPEWFVWQGDQGFLPKDEVKRQIELFGKKLLPRYV